MSVIPSSEDLIRAINKKGFAEDMWKLQQNQPKADPAVLQEIIQQCQQVVHDCLLTPLSSPLEVDDKQQQLIRARRYVAKDAETLSTIVQKRLSEITPIQTAQAAAPRLGSRVERVANLPSPTQAQVAQPPISLAPAPASRPAQQPQQPHAAPRRLTVREVLERKSPEVKDSNSSGGEKFFSPQVEDSDSSEEEFFTRFTQPQKQRPKRAETTALGAPPAPKLREAQVADANAEKAPQEEEAELALALKLSLEPEQPQQPQSSPARARDPLPPLQQEQGQQPQRPQLPTRARDPLFPLQGQGQRSQQQLQRYPSLHPIPTKRAPIFSDSGSHKSPLSPLSLANRRPPVVLAAHQTSSIPQHLESSGSGNAFRRRPVAENSSDNSADNERKTG